MKHLTALARIIRWHRRLVAATCAALGVLAVIQALGPNPEPTQPVVVTAHEVAGGHRLTAEDLIVAEFPTALGPDAAVGDPAELIGQTLTATTPRGVAVTSASVLGPSSIGPGTSLAPVRFGDADLARVLAVGDRIDIVAAGAAIGESAVVAADVRVVTIPEADDGGTLSTSASDGLLVLVEVTPADAATLAQVAGHAVLSPVLRQ